MKEHNDLTTLSVLKAGIWLYLLLLLFEGALRKWVLPGLADPLLVIRDPIALGLLAFAIYHKVMRWNGRVGFTRTLSEWFGYHSESVIQDIDIPFSAASDPCVKLQFYSIFHISGDEHLTLKSVSSVKCRDT